MNERCEDTVDAFEDEQTPVEDKGGDRPANGIAISAPELVSVLTRAERVAAKRSQVPILSMVLIRASNDELTITATDTDHEICWRIPCAGSLPAVAVAPDRLKAILGKYKGDANITYGNDRLSVHAGMARGHLSTLAGQDFPTLGQFADGDPVYVNSEEFKEALSAIQHAMSNEMTRYYLCGVHVNPERAEVVATDGHRLALYPLEFAGDLQSAILPRAAVKEILSLPDGDWSVSTGPVWRFEADQWSYTTKTIDGSFPDYVRLLDRPDDVSTVSVGRGQLASAVSQLKALACDQYKSVRIKSNFGKLSISARDFSEGRSDEMSITIDCEGEVPEFGVNAVYLLDFLEFGKEPKVGLTMGGPGTSLVSDEDGRISLTMTLTV